MDSQLYIVINPHLPLGQIISKRLAQKGNTVVYLTENEQEGYAIAAEEPRVRYRSCNPKNLSMLEEEMAWVSQCISTISGVVVITSEKEFNANYMPLNEGFFRRTAAQIGMHNTTLNLTYVIVPEEADTSREALRALHLKLCQLAHEPKTDSDCVNVNHVLVSSITYDDESCCVDVAADTTDLIHYLTSTTFKTVSQQAFYFGNNA
ncbi:hypothetical protein [Enterovibrio paralichthyis]|uniref:hypothetical protein n=1 Tax=Enterovibrio paralichthyis TaxID=2853805 RepID=UPI001C4789F2|nr:hypothetical protein [Enterovibrio paralichthyis]MBV7296775.1 hypothetical protein [Enterovibrio paralichthyis]